MSLTTAIEEMRKRFTLVCKNCGSENIAVDVTDHAAHESCFTEGALTMGCNNCKQNDMIEDV